MAASVPALLGEAANFGALRQWFGQAVAFLTAAALTTVAVLLMLTLHDHRTVMGLSRSENRQLDL